MNPMVLFKNIHTVNPNGSVTQGSAMKVTGHVSDKKIETIKKTPTKGIRSGKVPLL